MDVDELATGEVWYGPDALRRGLVDQLNTSDDVSA
jgi:serine protease SohB